MLKQQARARQLQTHAENLIAPRTQPKKQVKFADDDALQRQPPPKIQQTDLDPIQKKLADFKAAYLSQGGQNVEVLQKI